MTSTAAQMLLPLSCLLSPVLQELLAPMPNPRRSQQFLEDWRQETRERQQQQLSVGVARAAYFVPCAGTAASDSVDPHYHRTAQVRATP